MRENETMNREELNLQDYLFYVNKELTNSLNVYEGIIQPFTQPQAEDYWGKPFDVRWKGDIHFVVMTSKRHGWYYVIRDNQKISSSYCFSKVDKECILYMQRLIDDIESGRYHNKKTMKEQARSIVENRGLVSYMNQTKWKELLQEITINMEDVPLMYMTLFDETEPKVYWTLDGDEYFSYSDLVAIEWMKFKPVYEESEYQGRLVNPKITTVNREAQLRSVFTKYNIPYDYDESEKTYMVFGYR